MSAPDQGKSVLVVSYSSRPLATVRDAVEYLGGGASVERAGSLREALRLLDRHFDVVVVVTTAQMRLENYGTLVLLVSRLSEEDSAVYVICPPDDERFVAGMRKAGAKGFIGENYVVATLLEALVGEFPTKLCGG